MVKGQYHIEVKDTDRVSLTMKPSSIRFFISRMREKISYYITGFCED